MLVRLLREPLLHFLLLGGVLFAVFGRGGSTAGVDDRQIVVSEADIDRLASGFSRTWHRPPAANELQAQIQDYIREEVLYRSALTLGLDKDDTIIRRWLRQKMEFLFEDTVPQPQEPEMRDYFAAHTDKFRSQPLISFRQVFISMNRGGTAEADARQILARLVSAAPGAANEGDTLLLGEGFNRTALDRIATLFGADFAQAIAHAAPGNWVGPLRSAYGLHLVFVTTVEPTALPPFAQVRPVVEREWFAEHRAGGGGPVPGPARPVSSGRPRGAGGNAMMQGILWCGLVAALLLPAQGLDAHEVRPGFLELRETAANVFLMTWKVPALGEYRLAITPHLPESCRVIGEPTSMQTGAAFIRHERVRCARKLEGQLIAIDGLDATLTDVLVRIESLDGKVRSARLTPSSPSFIVPVQPGPLMVVRDYVGLGVEHILFGVDHLLFVLCLLLLVRGVRKLLTTVTAFTLAHSITLAAATLGFIRVPAASRRRSRSASCSSRVSWSAERLSAAR